MLIDVPIEKIKDNPWQTRAQIDPDYVAELGADIARNGLMQNPVGRMVIINGRYPDGHQVSTVDAALLDDSAVFVQIAIGHNRTAALKHIGRDTVPVHVATYSDHQMAQMAWSENEKRRDLSDIERARALQRTIDDFGWTQREASNRYGIGRSSVTNLLKLLALPEEIQQHNINGQLSGRQLDALHSIVRIQELTADCDIDWREKGEPEKWGQLLSPEKTIAYCIKNNVSSDEIREYGRRMAIDAGQHLHDFVATFKVDAPGVFQPKCKGCPARMQSSCLNKACLAAKHQAIKAAVLEDAAAELDVPVSTGPEDFEPYTYCDPTTTARLKAAWEGKANGFVLGWICNDAYRLRPFADSTYISTSCTFDNNGRAGLALGFRGELPEIEIEADDDSRPQPPASKKQIATWADESEQIGREAKKTAIAKLADAINAEVGDFDPFQAFIFSEDKEWVDDSQKMAGHVARFLIDNGRAVDGCQPSRLSQINQLDSALKRGGITKQLLGEKKVALHKTAVLILDYWYGNHYAWYAGEAGHKCLEYIKQWHAGCEASKLTLPITADIDAAAEHINATLIFLGEHFGDDDD